VEHVYIIIPKIKIQFYFPRCYGCQPTVKYGAEYLSTAAPLTNIWHNVMHQATYLELARLHLAAPRR